MAFFVLKGRLMPAHGETVGTVPALLLCVPAGRFMSKSLLPERQTPDHHAIPKDMDSEAQVWMASASHDEASRWDAWIFSIQHSHGFTVG